MNLDYVRNLTFAPIVQRYDVRDSALYALSSRHGPGSARRGRTALCLRGPRTARGPKPVRDALLAAVLAQGAGDRDRLAAHSARRAELLARPPACLRRARSAAEHRILAVEDKGAGRGAVVHTAHDIFDDDDWRASGRASGPRSFLRDDGGCGGFGTPRDTDVSAGDRRRTDRKSVTSARRLRRRFSTARRAATTCRSTPTPISRATPGSTGRSRMASTLSASPAGQCSSYSRRAGRERSPPWRRASPRRPSPATRSGSRLFKTPDGLRFRALALERSVLVLDRGEVGFL